MINASAGSEVDDSSHVMTYAGSAPGKIILSGEYAVVFGYPGIAVPAPLMMNVRYEPNPSPSPTPLSIVWDGANQHWHEYARNIARLCECVTGTITITTDLPLGKGMGSSTALVVAMARAFGADRATALSMEDTMNPGHSGLDFDVIWNNTPTVFQKGKASYAVQDAAFSLSNFSLLDSGMPNERTPALVAWVQGRANEPTVKAALATIGHCTERLLAGESLTTVIPDHHAAQVALGVVPESAQLMIKKIVQTFGPAKVIGAGGRTGGGGMILAFGTDHKALEAAFSHAL